MKRLLLSLAFVSTASSRLNAPGSELDAWTKQAQGITIVRDDWGIAHIHGKTDADAVFGMMYAQAEDDFNRVETNYLNSMGRLAEAEGESAVFKDLRMKLFIDPDSMKARYATSPDWLKKLMDSWAGGLNFYLAKHPEVKPRVITKFEPWMALSFSEGSIGGDIEGISIPGLQSFYGKAPLPTPPVDDNPAPKEPSGSNGIAIGPTITTPHHAMLLINPHTSFFFRSEQQVTSDEGLNAYGASTWGQFFIYQGFNATAGWMHTSSGVDAVDEFAESITKKGDGYTYKFGNEERPVVVSTIKVPFKTATGMETKTFTVYRTHHGPIVRENGGKWIAVSLMQEPVKALQQSYIRTKAKDLQDFMKSMDLHANSSNNTLFADKSGNIAFLYANYIARRNPALNWSQPVDGSIPGNDWQGLLSVKESPNVINPANGWVYNSNNWPWSAAGPNSPKRDAFPPYIEKGNAESPRGVHAIRVLSDKKDFTLQGLLDAAFDSYQPSFAEQIPPLVKAYDDTPDGNAAKAKVADQITLLRKWDFRWSAKSVETSLAVYYSQQGGRRSANATPEQLLAALGAASDKLAADFGTWKTPWGDINRFQRINDDIVQKFDDAKPSIPVMFSSANYGSLASFGARTYPGTKKMYGTSGNSFVAVVEFGDSVRARAVTAGGESGDPSSKHFNDQAERYATGNLRPVYFYPNQLTGHTERTYHPGG